MACSGCRSMDMNKYINSLAATDFYRGQFDYNSDCRWCLQLSIVFFNRAGWESVLMNWPLLVAVALTLNERSVQDMRWDDRETIANIVCQLSLGSSHSDKVCVAIVKKNTLKIIDGIRDES